MKRIFLIVLVLIFQVCTVSAYVEKHTDNGINYKMSYPIIYTDNKIAQDKISQDIYHYIAAFRNDFKTGKFYNGAFSYEIKYEDKDIISLTIEDYRYSMGAAHGYSRYYGIVYDKQTGQKLPLRNFLKITAQDLKYFYYDHSYNRSTINNKEYRIDNPWDFGEAKVSENYYLMGNGGIALMYNPYEITSYNDGGVSTIQFSAEDVDYFNRKNNS